MDLLVPPPIHDGLLHHAQRERTAAARERGDHHRYAEQGDHHHALAAVTPIAPDSPWARRGRFLAGLSQLNLKKNDEVVAAGGLFGRVVEIKGPVVWLELGQNLRVKVERRSIEPAPAPTKPAKAEEPSS